VTAVAGVSSDRVKILCDAFSSTVKNLELPVKAEKARLETNWSTGEQVQDMMIELIDQPSRYLRLSKSVIQA
jgi:hypothetical protein